MCTKRQATKNMDPAMMQQARQMMSDPAMAQQAMERMDSMSGEDLKSSLDLLPAAGPAAGPAAAAAAAPAAPATVLAKLKASYP